MVTYSNVIVIIEIAILKFWRLKELEWNICYVWSQKTIFHNSFSCSQLNTFPINELSLWKEDIRSCCWSGHKLKTVLLLYTVHVLIWFFFFWKIIVYFWWNSRNVCFPGSGGRFKSIKTKHLLILKGYNLHSRLCSPLLYISSFPVFPWTFFFIYISSFSFFCSSHSIFISLSFSALFPFLSQPCIFSS